MPRMGIIANIKKRKVQHYRHDVIMYGMILCGFNTALALGLFFVSQALLLGMLLLGIGGIGLFFIPMVMIFGYAVVSTLVWYRFGQIIGHHFKGQVMTTAGSIVFISVVPLFLLSIIASTILSWWWQVSPLTAISFVLTVLVVVLATLFEVFIVNFGAATKHIR